MKIEAKKLKAALDFVSAFIPSQTPLLPNMVRLRKGIEATDYTGYAYAPLDLDIDVCVNGALLKAFVDKVEGEVTLTLDTALKLAGGGRRATLAIANDYPSLPIDEEPVAEIAGVDLRAMFDSVIFAHAKKDMARPYLEGVFLESKGGELSAVASDGGVMAMHTVKHDCDPFGVIIPGKVLRRIDEIERATIFKAAVRFTAADGSITCPIIDGAFPEWRRIAHVELPCKFQCNAAALREAVAVCAPFSDDDQFVSLDATTKLTVRGGDGQQIDTEVDYSGDAFAAAFKIRNLLDVLPQVGETATFKFDTGPKGKYITSHGYWSAVVMPVLL